MNPRCLESNAPMENWLVEKTKKTTLKTRGKLLFFRGGDTQRKQFESTRGGPDRLPPLSRYMDHRKECRVNKCQGISHNMIWIWVKKMNLILAARNWLVPLRIWLVPFRICAKTPLSWKSKKVAPRRVKWCPGVVQSGAPGAQGEVQWLWTLACVWEPHQCGMLLAGETLSSMRNSNL